MSIIESTAVEPAGDSSAAEGRVPTLDDFMTATAVHEFTWLPGTDSLVFIRDSLETGTREIWRVDRSGGAEPIPLTGTIVPELRTHPLAAERAEPKADLTIAGDGSRIFFTSARYFQAMDNILSMAPDGSDIVQHTFHDAVIETAPAPSPDGRTLAYFTRTERGTKVFLLDLTAERSWPQLLSPGPDPDRKPVWSPDSRYISFERKGDVWVRELASGAERRLAAAAWDRVGNPVWSPDSTRVAVTADASGFAQIAVVDVATGALTAITRAPREHGTPSWSPDGTTLTFTFADGIGLSSQVAVAPADGSAEPTAITSGTGIRKMPQFTGDGSEIAYLDAASNRAPDIWVTGAQGGTPQQVTRSMGRLDPAVLSVAQEVTYPTIDNLPIPALLFTPPHFDPTRTYPVVVALHGHPSIWNHSMNLLWQWVISRGVVLLAPNPRGTVGLGKAFHDMHVGDFGGHEFEDIMASVDLLNELPFVDDQRKATWGGSGGGYMSLYIAGKAPQVFDAQVIRAPVSDWKWLAMDRFTGQARYATPKRDPQRAREEMGGAYTDIPDRYEERSPLNFVENVTIPQLLMHGRRDGSVPLNESRRWSERMNELGKGDLLEYVEFPDEDHSLLRYRSTVREQAERIVAFLAKNLSAPQLLDGWH